MPMWEELAAFLPQGLKPGIQLRSALAASFAANLELAKAGRVCLRQDELFGLLFVRARSDPAEPRAGSGGYSLITPGRGVWSR